MSGYLLALCQEISKSIGQVSENSTEAGPKNQAKQPITRQEAEGIGTGYYKSTSHKAKELFQKSGKGQKDIARAPSLA